MKLDWIYRGLMVLVVAVLVGACTPSDEKAIQDMLNSAQKTAEAAIKQKGPDVLTEIARLGGTAVNEGKKVAETAAKAAETAAMSVKQTSEAFVETQKAKVVPPSVVTTAPGRLPITVTPSRTPTSTPTRTTTPTGMLRELDYFALGDSIASGHGLFDDKETCHRSVIYGYPARLTELLRPFYKVNFSADNLRACSGATAGEPDVKVLYESKDKWLANQIQTIVLDRYRKDVLTLVTITIGANDLNWTDAGILGHLVEPKSNYDKWLTGLSSTIENAVFGWVGTLLADRKNVFVVITGPINPLNSKSVMFDQGILSSIFPNAVCDLTGDDCTTRAKNAVSAVNNALKNAINKINKPDQIAFVDLVPDFSSHAAPKPECGTGDPDVNNTWIQYPGDKSSNAPIPFMLRLVLINFDDMLGDCFHPNQIGAEMISRLIYPQAVRLIK